ncbi:MAG TPA: SHOCT domain-containing protein [Candidatus Dormibacteraeota bacterium]|nr:SHOCT domain-containing protein [Candidatus Dormibacteraeota bacterium]
MWDYGVGGLGWLWMGVMMVLFWGGVIVVAVWAFRSFAGPRAGADPAFDLLRRRLAAGEITPEEFERLRKALGA